MLVQSTEVRVLVEAARCDALMAKGERMGAYDALRVATDGAFRRDDRAAYDGAWGAFLLAQVVEAERLHIFKGTVELLRHVLHAEGVKDAFDLRADLGTEYGLPAPVAEEEDGEDAWSPGLPHAMFRDLTPEEEADFRGWARDHFTPGEAIIPTWHPVVREECRKMEAEAPFWVPAPDAVDERIEAQVDAAEKAINASPDACPDCHGTGVMAVPGMAGGTEVYVCSCPTGKVLPVEQRIGVEEENRARIMRAIV